jgi:hypothetical protein
MKIFQWELSFSMRSEIRSRTVITKLISSFRNFANASNNYKEGGWKLKESKEEEEEEEEEDNEQIENETK